MICHRPLKHHGTRVPLYVHLVLDHMWKFGATFAEITLSDTCSHCGHDVSDDAIAAVDLNLPPEKCPGCGCGLVRFSE